MVIDTVGTTFEAEFDFSAGSYGNANDPNLDGKPVLVLAVKTTDASGTVTTNYSFLDLDSLLSKISADAGNIIELKSDGIYATTRVTGAVEGNVTIFDANGFIN